MYLVQYRRTHGSEWYTMHMCVVKYEHPSIASRVTSTHQFAPPNVQVTHSHLLPYLWVILYVD